MKNYSKQREAIVRMLSGTDTHPTAEEIYCAVRENFPNISLATVYRNLRLLREEGAILSVHTDGETERFDWNTRPHAHFKCRVCKRVRDRFLTQEELAVLRNISEEEFELNFIGICEECKKINKNITNSMEV